MLLHHAFSYSAQASDRIVYKKSIEKALSLSKQFLVNENFVNTISDMFVET